MPSSRSNRKAWLWSGASIVAIALSSSQALSEVITVNSHMSIPISNVIDATGTINVNAGASVTTQFGGNHAIQPNRAGIGAWTVNVDGQVKVLDVDNEVYGVWLRGGGTVNVGLNGSVEGSRKGIVIEGGLADVVNDGLVSGSWIATHVLNGGTVLNNGTMLGGVVFATSVVAGTLTNEGTISSDALNGFGIIMNAGGSFTNRGSALFEEIGQGFKSFGDVTFVNSGTLQAAASNGNLTQTSGAMFQNGNIDASNSGTVEGRDLGMFFSQGTADLTNSGTIRGLWLDAVNMSTATGTADFTQAAGLLSGGRHGLSISTSAATSISLTGGEIAGGTYRNDGIGIRIAGSGDTDITVSNATVRGVAAAIQGGSGNLDVSLLDGSLIYGLVDLGTGTSSLRMSTGAVVQGDIRGSTGLSSLELAGTGTGNFSGAFSGFETALVSGGTWVLGGNSTFANGITVSAGSLIVNGSIVGGVTVNPGGYLGGSGSTGSMTFGNGSIIAPGNSIGTLNVAGNLNLAAGSVYEVEVDPASAASDLIAVTGIANLNGAAVRHVGYPGAYNPASTYTILTAGSIVGTFGSVTSDFAFLDPVLGYSPTAVTLSLARNDVGLADVANTANQRAAASAIARLGTGNIVNDTVVGLDAAGARRAYDLLSGEIHASAYSALIEDSRHVREAAADRLRSAFGKDGATAEWTAWSMAYGSWGRLGSDGNAAGLSVGTGGFLAGADVGLDNTWRIGFLTGYGQSDFDASGRSSSGSSDNYHLGVYGGAQWGSVALRSGIASTWHSIDTNRSITFPGFSDRVSADYGASTTQLFSELGYAFQVGGMTLEPFGNLAHVYVNGNSFGEAGGSAALAGQGGSNAATFSTIGLRAERDLSIGGAAVRAHGMIGWRHAYGDATPEADLRFASGATFGVNGTPVARDVAAVSAGLDFELGGDAALQLSYEGQFGSGVQDHGANARLSVSF